MIDLLIALGLWVGLEFWLPAAILILLSLIVVGAPTSQLRGIAMSAIFVLIAIYAAMAQQWLIVAITILYAAELFRQAQVKPIAPVQLINSTLPRPWRALALAGAAIFVGIWLLGVKRTIVWRFSTAETASSFSDLLTALQPHLLTMLLIGTALLLTIRKKSVQTNQSVSLLTGERELE